MKWQICRALSVTTALALMASVTLARPPIRSEFFSVYPGAENTQLDQLPSDSKHCGVCHFDFSGGGPRNPYGLDIEVGRNNGLSDLQAILAIETADSDADGKSNLVEITDVGNYTNTPTFPGLSASNVGLISNIPPAEVTPYLTPSGGTDGTPPTVAVLWPNGGESLTPMGEVTVTYSASDASGIDHVNLFLSEDSGVTRKTMALNLPDTGSITWFVPNLPSPTSRVIVEAVDGAGNPGEDQSDADFGLDPHTGGIAPTTLRDMELSGTQAFEGAILDDPSVSCVTCHGNYDVANEPWANWKGSMMAQAARDPIFFACLAIAEQDAPSVGDLCLRCHTPGGWQEGRSTDTSGGMLTAKDRQGIHCDFCHRAVDPNYVAGVSPIEDLAVLGNISPLPLQNGNGQFISDPAPLRRGPYADAQASHQFVESPYHRSSDMCGTCHDVSSPVFDSVTFLDYVPGAFDSPHYDMDTRHMLPIERTYSEWQLSEYATTGVYAPQFAGNKPDGIVSTCQDCHMRDVDAKGANVGGAPRRADLGLHDFTGGNTFIQDMLPDFFPGEVDVASLNASKARATAMLQLAASLSLTPEPYGVEVRVTNETGHRLTSGYPEGRRIWLQVEARSTLGEVVYTSGAYDPATGVLTHDEDLKIYEIHPGLSNGLAAALGLPAGPSFHFVLNDTVYSDNRIPPRGFTNAAFEAAQSPPVGYSYEDGEYWDETEYHLPVDAVEVTVDLYYQGTSREYVEFLRDENVTNSAGQDFYDAWVAHGRAAPVLMATATVPVTVTVTGIGNEPAPRRELVLQRNAPNPFRGSTRIAYTLPAAGPTELRVFDVRGRQVRELWSGHQPAGDYHLDWNARDDQGRTLPSGIYFLRLVTREDSRSQRVILVD